ncbi:hypothetical protein CcaCcLH18_11107 [Colletotrichum camelliae]|nr:hypothetical protein CcaCcLH18_11107 [Colletotrichum camelliae]
MPPDNYFSNASVPLTPLSPEWDDMRKTEQRVLIASHPSPPSTPAAKDPTAEKPNPRVLLARRLWDKTWLIHFAAVAFTGAVVQFTFREFYWFDEDNWDSAWLSHIARQDVTINVLQFVAKVHEILIVASVSAMVMHACRRMLVGDGIPFGFLTGAYQVSSAEWLFSKNYIWAAKKRRPDTSSRHYISTRKHVAMGLAALCICVYCNTVGPSSAIVVIPELGWWEVKSSLHDSVGVSYVMTSLGRFFPLALTDESIPSGCNYTTSVNGTWCPQSGYDELEMWAKTVSGGGPFSPMDITQADSGVRRQVSSSTMGREVKNEAAGEDNARLLSVATTPHSSLTELSGAFWSYVEAHEIAGVERIGRPQLYPKEEVYSPLVQVQCKIFAYTDTRSASVGDEVVKPFFDTSEMRNFTALAREEEASYQKRTWPVPEQFWNYARDHGSLNRTNFTWVDAAAIFPESPSLASVLEVPMVLCHGADHCAQDSLIIPCMMDVRWAGVEVSLDPNKDRLLQHNLSDLSKTFKDKWDDPKIHKWEPLQSLSAQNVPISMEWANLLNEPMNDTRSGSGNVILNTTAMASLFEKFVYSSESLNRNFTAPLFRQDTPFPEMVDSVGRTVARVISHTLVDGMSRVTYWNDLGLVREDYNNGTFSAVDLTNIAGGLIAKPQNTNTTMLANWTTFHWKLRRYGYGFGFASRTTQFGVVILLAHVAMVLVYTLYILLFRFSKRGWSSGAWGGLDEMLLLAITSRPTKTTRFAGTGISSNRMFEARARIRERGYDEVELIVGDETEDEHRLRQGKKYL